VIIMDYADDINNFVPGKNPVQDWLCDRVFYDGVVKDLMNMKREQVYTDHLARVNLIDGHSDKDAIGYVATGPERLRSVREWEPVVIENLRRIAV